MASAEPPPEMRISEGAVAFMFESSRPFTVTDWAMKSKKLHEHDPKMWDDLVDNFSTHKEEVEELCRRAKELGWSKGGSTGINLNGPAINGVNGK